MHSIFILFSGQTGTGKTHTMLGIDMWNFARDKTKTNPFISPDDIYSTALYKKRDLWGIIPRVLDDLFKYVNSNESIECSVFIYYILD